MADLGKAVKIFQREEEEIQYQNKAEVLKYPYVSLVGSSISPEILQTIPKELAEKHKTVAYFKIGRKVRVASPYPEAADFLPFLKTIAQASALELAPAVCSPTSLEYGLKQYEFIEPAPAKVEKVEFKKVEAWKAEKPKTIEELKAQIEKISTTRALDLILEGALAMEASDIHLEPEEADTRLRFRIDGVLQDIARLPLAHHKTFVSRIKYLAKLKLDITNLPQEGRFEISLPSGKIDIRASVFPTGFGETVVLRILMERGKLLSLEELGFSQTALKDVDEAIKKPNGIIFNTGPTGSGKTTTLYAVIQKLNKPGVKIITLEDPIEYRIEGVDQAQIDERKGFSFLIGLRSALRQDPDIVMIGEVRDPETARTALRAALTGHLVLSTLHTNSAPSAFPRLLDMGAEPYLLSGSVNLIIAQRLVRKICKDCGGKGCAVCHGTGFHGRIAIVETLKMSPKINELIARKASIDEFERAAREEGMKTMFEDGREKVKQGITTEEEVRRVTSES